MRLSTRSTQAWIGWTACLMLCVGLAGCGKSSDMPDLGAVTGELTKDGVPYVGAAVEFRPDGHGAPSYGKTDDDGKFELMYSTGKTGAATGTHTVIVIGGHKKTEVVENAPGESVEGDLTEVPPPPASPSPKSATKKKLTAEVTEEGPNHIVLEL